MADANVGNITASLRVDSSEWARGLQQAQQQLAQFEQTIARMTGTLNQFGQAFQQAMGQNQQGLATLAPRAQAASQSFQQFNTQLNQTNQAFTVVNQTVQTFNSHLSTTTNTVNNVRQGLQQAQGSASGFGSILQGALSVAGGLGIVTTIGGIVSGLKSLATEALQAAARMENLRAQFTALQGSVQGAITLQGLFQTAQRLGVEFGTLATAFRQFDAATRGTSLEGERARRVFEQITTGMRGMGTSSEQVGRALLALQQMVSKGTVSQEELRQQLGEALPGAMGIAARAFGVTTQEMNKMIEKGMDASQFVLAFGNQVEREFGGKAATATNTLTAAWQRFSNELEQFSGALAGSTLVATLRDLANSATTLLETLRKGREERERAAGGPVPTLPRDAALSPVIQARQTEIDRLAQRIEALQTGQLVPGIGQFLTPMIERLGNERRQLIEAQGKAAAEFQRRLAGEAGAYEGAIDPVQASADRMIKIVEEGQKRLREIDLQGAFLTPLEQAEQKTKAWEETTKKLGDEWNRIGEGLRRTLIPTGRTTPFDEMITQIAGEKGLDPNLMRALVEQESGFNPTARSRAGAMGLMQLMPGTARQLGVPAGREFDPETNLRAGMTYFAELLARFNGNVERALTAYNAGPGRGGIPLPTGENATFAQDVLRRIPQGPGEIMQQVRRQQEALRLGEEAEKPDTESRARIMATGRAELQAMEERERLADAAARERRQQAFATGQEYIRGLDAEIAKQDQQMATLQRLAETYGEVKAANDASTASDLQAKLAKTVHAEEADKLAKAILSVAQIEAQLPALRRQAALSAPAGELAIKRVQDEAAALRVLEENLEQARIPRGAGGFPFGRTREELRLQQRTGEDIRSPEGQQRAQELQRARLAQEQLNYAAGIFVQLGGAVEQAWSGVLEAIFKPTEDTGAELELGRVRERLAGARNEQRALQASQAGLRNLTVEQQRYAQSAAASTTSTVRALEEQERALVKVSEGTNRVAEAFKAMAQSILQSMAQIASQEAFKALIGLGVRLITGAALGGAGAGLGGESPAAVGAGINPIMFQGGGMVNRPTMAMLGENPAHNPEVVLNRQQMQSLFGGTTSGGSQQQVSIHNYPSKAAAEQGAAQQRALGQTAIINAVLDELSTGESSRINRTLRSLQR